MNMAGKATLITGGSRGLGRALGEALSRAGARVVLVARDPQALRAAAAHIRATGGEVETIVADVADKQATYAIAGQAAALVGPIDLLINNASTLGPVPLRPLLDTDCEDLERALAVNLVGAFRLTKAVVGSMLLRGHGLILNVTSDAAAQPYPGWGAYGASKAALEHLGRIWAAELAGTGVAMLNVDPGEMNTRMHAEAMPDADPATLTDPAVVAERLLALVQRTVVGEPGRAKPAAATAASAATIQRVAAEVSS